MAVNKLEKVNINNSEQWILVRGKHQNSPLIIHVQAGPGLPMIPEADTMERLLHLEDEYLVAYWDQRACGKSFTKNINPSSVNIPQLTDDLISCTEYLLQKYNQQKAILIGYSIGATLSLLAAAKNASLFTRLFLVGIDIDIPFANKYAIEFAWERAEKVQNKKLMNEIAELKESPIVEAKRFQKRARLLTNMGGIKVATTYNELLLSSVKNMLFSSAYRLTDIPRTARGMEFSQNALLAEMNALNLFERVRQVGVPVHFFQGKLDVIAPFEVAERFYHYLKAPAKTFTTFEKSAHVPHYDEPKKFELILKQLINQR